MEGGRDDEKKRILDQHGIDEYFELLPLCRF